MIVPKQVVLRAGILSLLASYVNGAVHEILTTAPSGWQAVGNPDENTLITLSVALQQQNLDKLESTLYAVSDPTSAQYGNHLEREDVQAMVQPKSESNDAVLAWLKSEGINQIYSDGEYVNFAATIGTANKLLGAQFKKYESDGLQKIRTLQYSIPSDLQQHVDFVHPTTYFGNTVAQAPILHYPEQDVKARAADPSCSTLITPKCLREIYNINYTPDPKSGSKIAFGSFLNQSARFEDLARFEKENGVPSQNFSVELINGGVNDQTISSNHGEADLDVENIVGLSHPLPIISYITAGSPPFIPSLDEPAENDNEPYLDYYKYLLAKPNNELPQVITNSYGDPEETVPIKYAMRVCNQIAQLGCRGISVLESSGDTGVGAACKSNDGRNTTIFIPQFPGTCPYITAVGGTQSIDPEIAWVASSGGFSNYFPQPAYQKQAISTYLSKHIKPETVKYYAPFTNFSGRGFPDVAAHSLTPE